MSERKKVLFVDDNRDFLNLVLEDLESDQYELLTIHVTPSLEVVEEIKKLTPDLIFLDVMFAKNFSNSVASGLRKNELFKKTPIYLMSFLDIQEILAIANKNEVNGCFMKPIEQEDIKELFLKHFQLEIKVED